MDSKRQREIEEFNKELSKQLSMIERSGVRVLLAFQCIKCAIIFDDVLQLEEHRETAHPELTKYDEYDNDDTEELL